MIRIGYACINTQLPSPSRTCRINNATQERILSLSRNNLGSLESILLWNQAHGIQLFRISSETIPFGSHPVNRLPWWKILAPELTKLSHLLKRFNMRVSMHPGQYTVLNSNRKAVVTASIAELKYHARLMDALMLDSSHKIIIHVGGAYGDKQDGLKRFIKNFKTLPPQVRKRLAVENDEKIYTAEDVLAVSKELHTPMVFDVFHHRCNPSFHDNTLPLIIEKIAPTWRSKDGPLKLHYSNQQAGKAAGAHAESINATKFKRFLQHAGLNQADIMLEVKNKERSVLEIYRHIPSLKTVF